MPSIFHLLPLLPISLAFPNILGRDAGLTSVTLKQELHAKWYTKYNEQKPDMEPDNPSGIYPCYGPMVDDYPGKNEWLSFKTLWKINVEEITKANTVYKDKYNNELKEAIQDVSEESKLDARLILSIIMQESHGNLSVPCTNGGTDCGLMQLRGSRNFTEDDPKTSIMEVIQDGVYGVHVEGGGQLWPGFLPRFNDLSEEWASPFAAAHVYNVGNIQSANLTDAPDASEGKWYANDIAARLKGWNGASDGCKKSRDECTKLNFWSRQCW